MSPYKAQIKTLKELPRTAQYEFTLVLDGVIEITAKIENALFESGCDDATLSMKNGRAFLLFSREAPSLTDAVLSAIRDVARSDIGASVLRVDESQLVTQADIARKLWMESSACSPICDGSSWTQMLSGSRRPVDPTSHVVVLERRGLVVEDARTG